MNKISFTIPKTNTNPFELTNVKNVNPKIIKKNIDYIKLAPNVYKFCKNITL
jgi:hypothetical protein